MVLLAPAHGPRSHRQSRPSQHMAPRRCCRCPGIHVRAVVQLVRVIRNTTFSPAYPIALGPVTASGQPDAAVVPIGRQSFGRHQQHASCASVNLRRSPWRSCRQRFHRSRAGHTPCRAPVACCVWQFDGLLTAQTSPIQRPWNRSPMACWKGCCLRSPRKIRTLGNFVGIVAPQPLDGFGLSVVRGHSRHVVLANQGVSTPSELLLSPYRERFGVLHGHPLLAKARPSSRCAIFGLPSCVLDRLARGA